MGYYQLPKNLSELDHFRSDPRVQFKEENVGGVDVVTPVYMIADAQFWKTPMALELRGHVFRKDTGELISAALPKFFNVGENDYTQRGDLPWDEVVSVADKVDGSMITFALIDDKVYAKTKKSFYSDVAIEAQKYLDSPFMDEHELCFIKNMMRNSMSPIYEFWHPEWQIVLNYGDHTVLKYLGCRDLTDSEWVPGMDQVKGAPNIIAALEHYQNTVEDVEGIVVQFKDGRVVKWKTKWYCMQHNVRTDMRTRDVAEMAALETLDDVKALVVESGMDLSKIETIEAEVSRIIGEVRMIVEMIVESAKKACPTAKDCAHIFRNDPYFMMIMRGYRGQEIDYAAHFLKYHLKSFPLNCVYNEKF